MSKRKREAIAKAAIENYNHIPQTGENAEQTDFKQNRWRSLSGQNKLLTVAIICLVSFGALGAGLKYLDEDARRELAKRNDATPLNPVKNESMLNSVNPFLPAPTPTPEPQLSKELIYAGSRLLSVVDANATAAPPTDLAVWRPSSGTWYVMGASGVVQTSAQWGTSGDVPAPGDYDGDGKTDFSIFRPSSSTWWIMKSSDNTFYSHPFGIAGDQIAQADYDGDGRTDVAVFRNTGGGLGTWYVERSSSGFLSQQFGLSNDKPASADYDGDGRADIGVWRNSDKIFYSLDSTNNALRASTAFAQTSNEPVPADYDGDFRADHAIRSANDWIIRNSSNNQIETVSLQLESDKAVQNDYDGDGRVDIAVFRQIPSSQGASDAGRWFIRQSSRIGQANELRLESWGTTGDFPVPAFYRR